LCMREIDSIFAPALGVKDFWGEEEKKYCGGLLPLVFVGCLVAPGKIESKKISSLKYW
jgi:hypothetical protein